MECFEQTNKGQKSHDTVPLAFSKAPAVPIGEWSGLPAACEEVACPHIETVIQDSANSCTRHYGTVDPAGRILYRT